ncbi:aminopeptidase N [Thiohalobacter sp.]|uniref:aminopeptidase N n=1 Tax=Thiohalobacter sp. TaxID=2025948 RepID=UPI0026398F79|nr:aminopeptidase N [Thiohalobacter sp.]
MEGGGRVSRPREVFLRDYRPPAFLVDRVDLRFELDPDDTRVLARLAMRRNPAAAGDDVLVLDGEDLTLEGLRLDGEPLPESAWALDTEGLRIPGVPEAFELQIETRVRPRDNSELSGLYLSGDSLCTQCEAEGFRRITFYPDRPDVLARFTTTLVADRERFPVLLSNGNRIDAGTFEDGRHWVRWEDPFPKPSYLFALVAGPLAEITDHYVTASGREVTIAFYVEPHNAERCGHAIASLKRAMRWDEQVYGREYDLDRYMVVAVDDFNMGAMENKGLNIFNSKFVLASSGTATDQDYVNIESVIGHEYFHNWSGNRVTCRDWFQLSLKEGFTVFRDQCFSADMGGGSIKRIQDVDLLRTHQFREDAGPMAHPVRPERYAAIDNFYTLTVYNKGAEVVRMLHTLLGPEGFHRGTDLYFERHDGQAVTVEDFIVAMEAANGVNLALFRRWYSQAGTPRLKARWQHNPAAGTLALTLAQRTPPTPGQPDKLPLHIPVRVALLDRDGRRQPLRLYGEAEAQGSERVLNLCEAEETFVFQDVAEDSLPSLLRGFSAPVILEADYDNAALARLLAEDDDPFSRWDAGQTLARRVLLARIAGVPDADGEHLLREAFRKILDEPLLDPGLAAELLALPGENYLAEFVEPLDPGALFEAREGLARELAGTLAERWREAFALAAVSGPYHPTPEAIGRRSLRARCLDYLVRLDTPEVHALAEDLFAHADNMTESLAALRALVNSGAEARAQALADFHARWRNEPLVLDKWFAIQASSRHPDTLDRVEALAGHPDFNPRNPNRVYALLRSFAGANPRDFHHPSGRGYRLLGHWVREIDAHNPQLAARLARGFSQWASLTPERQQAAHDELKKIQSVVGLSKDTSEVVARLLEAGA